MTPLPRLEDTVEFAENPEPRCACVLLLDTSGSMAGAPITALNDGLKVLKDSLSADPLASQRVEIAVVTFDSEVRVVQDFVTVDRFEPPALTAQNLTYMGSAIHQALDMLTARKARYKANGVQYYRPWVFLITDGAPQGEADTIVQEAARRIREDEDGKRVAFFGVGVQDADMDRLRQIVVRAPVKLVGLNFREMFLWLSKSMSAVSGSKVDDKMVALTPPSGWGSV
ncbi:MAG: VWA domain-containing protein [Acidobacteria bacterium]|nr:VWA domain-containing protein [Acidobacteriota bacterium]